MIIIKKTIIIIKEVIHRCYNNELEYYIEDITEIKEKNISIPEKGDGRDDTTQIVNRVCCIWNNCQLQENMYGESCKRCEKGAHFLGSKPENRWSDQC